MTQITFRPLVLIICCFYYTIGGMVNCSKILHRLDAHDSTPTPTKPRFGPPGISVFFKNVIRPKLVYQLPVFLEIRISGQGMRRGPIIYKSVQWLTKNYSATPDIEQCIRHQLHTTSGRITSHHFISLHITSYHLCSGIPFHWYPLSGQEGRGGWHGGQARQDY